MVVAQGKLYMCCKFSTKIPKSPIKFGSKCNVLDLKLKGEKKWEEIKKLKKYVSETLMADDQYLYAYVSNRL